MKDIIEPVDTDDGLFHDGDPSTGAEGTIVYARIMNSIMNGVIDIQAENKNILAEAGLKPDPSKTNQLLTALKALFLLSGDQTITGALQKSKNLADLDDKDAAKKALDLEKVGNWPAVQANGGLHSSGNHRIYLDWGADGKLHSTVDDTDVGELFTTKNPPKAAQSGAYPATGGNLNEEASVSVISNVKSGKTGETLYSPMFRCVLKGHGGDQDFKDGASGFMRLVEEVGRLAYLQLQWDGFGSVHEFRFDQQGNSQVYGKVYTGSGASFLAEDGNVYGGAWGGYLSNFLASNWNNAVYSARRGGQQYQAGSGTGQGMTWESPAGCFLTGINTNVKDGRGMGVYFRRFQLMNKTGGWWEIGD